MKTMTLPDKPVCDAAVQGKISEFFDYLHTHAEISMKETKTTEWIKKRLDALGCRTQTFSDCPGVINRLRKTCCCDPGRHGCPLAGSRRNVPGKPFLRP